ncbi:MATE family efflux transporter [Marinobacterium aestuariivivens]|uniref:Multidrug export protein MepA n=1 Tax=Marinobacterium aestuariivivens TaxID=1698799 RepID=A0ABW2A4I9_9GAMM
MMSSRHSPDNRFLIAPTGRLFFANALPMMLVMTMNGLLNVVDATFLGYFVGTNALAAVSIVFPVFMITVALSTLVSGGMSSLLARHLGADARDQAAAVFARAHGLALCTSLTLIAIFLVGGRAGVGYLADGQNGITEMAHTYLSIMIYATPVQFLLGLHADTWRNEGRAGLMALMSVGVTLANIALNYVLIVILELGVAGSAWGTVLAQGLGLGLLIGLRLRGGSGLLPLNSLGKCRWTGGWRPILALGAPLSLSFIGIAFVSATLIATLKLTAEAGYADTIAAYGIVTRIFSFTFLPLMAIALATQSIAGNNVGAGLYLRSDAVLRLALGTALLYCIAVEIILLGSSHHIGAGFVRNQVVVAQVGAILRPMVYFYLFVGPLLVLALYFQAVGQPGRAAALTLAKPLLLCPVLIVALGFINGAEAIWFAFPIADGLVASLAIVIVIASLKRHRAGSGFGLAIQGEPT